MTKMMLNTLKKINADKPPVWFMRQAGRYLPEYRALRQKAGGFLNMCYTPEYACEVTLQPIRRFGFDAAILFSDILVIPDALGQTVDFVPNKGPMLEPIDFKTLSLENLHSHLAPVYAAIKLIRSQLDKEGFKDTTLIGFAGAPFTVATYMIEGSGTKDFMKFKKFLYGEPEQFEALINLLVEATAQYLIAQIEAGAEVVQLFESWAGAVGGEAFEKYIIGANQKIIETVKAAYPDIPVIGFPKAAGYYLKDYMHKTGIDALGCDFTLPLAFIRDELQSVMPVQGNLDPGILYAGGEVLDRQVKEILFTLKDKPYIFNLGHGIHKETPIAHVERVLSIIREN
jgi:uroporphyrinogen decarboxylase|tara:strand:+ start:231500 stop:232525 length:1026 start_codon:yes stop_codon:yes gene_type:complete